MWDWADDQVGLDMCNYARYYVNERKSVARVGQDEHDRYVALIADLVFNNGMSCGLPTP
mgnify:CR=1 FL=1